MVSLERGFDLGEGGDDVRGVGAVVEAGVEVGSCESVSLGWLVLGMSNLHRICSS